MPDDLKKYLDLKLKNIIDPNEIFYKQGENEMPKPIRVKAIHNTDYDSNSRNFVFDPVLEDFIIGCKGKLSKVELEKFNDATPLVIRGLATDSQLAIKRCQENNIDFYAIDTGYLQPGTKKDYHRITKNGLQNIGPIIDRDTDRLSKLNWKYRQHTPGNKILICPPSEKVMKFYNLDLSNWLASIIDTIKTKTNKPIEIRTKPTRSDRVTNNTIWKAMENAHCLITFNSIAATEAILYGVPAITLAPNAASVICNTSLDDINTLHTPNKTEVTRFAAHLAYCQFTSAELRSGYAWNIVK